MILNIEKKMVQKNILVKDLNPCLTCPLCEGYFIDATSLVDCLHVFCRSCILHYFENFKLACPTCNVIYKKKNTPCYRSDPVIQALVYKLVPGLCSREIQRRKDFYRSTGVRASSSCSEDSVLGELNDEHQDWVLSTRSDLNEYFSPDEVISLSLEYYKPYLDTTQDVNKSTKVSDKDSSELQTNKSDDNKISGDSKLQSDIKDEDVKVDEGAAAGDNPCDKKGDTERRYLQCPAAVTMSHLQKFLRMKYALSVEHRVDIIYLGEVLPAYFSLMDVAYTFKWKRIEPMRFFFRIFTPAKIQPIKIISTSSMGGKQLQVVLSKPNSLNFPPPEPKPSSEDLNSDLDDQNYRNKERLMANLQLQSKAKMLEKSKEHQNGTSEKSYRLERLKPVKLCGSLPGDDGCIYEYEEPDKDEIRAFAEKRDREWALQKQLDEEREKHRNGKKRKKSKHSKNNLLYKKRKLHAEITSNECLEKEESLKLKVKLTPHNGYKHKHHKSNHSSDSQSKSELSSKEKLLQMRQVRHKHNISSTDEKKSSSHAKTDVKEEPNAMHESKAKHEPKVKHEQPEPKPAEVSKAPEPPKELISSTKTLRSDFSNKTNSAKEGSKFPLVHIERNEQTERHAAQKTALKTFKSYTESYSQTRDVAAAAAIPTFKPRPAAPNTYSGRNHLQATKALEQKIASLQQQCTTVETKQPQAQPKNSKKHSANEKPQPHILNSQYTTGFTVSKVEVGGKRKLENDQQLQDKFPSLEITLINPSVEKSTLEVRPGAKPSLEIRPASKAAVEVRPVSKSPADVRLISKSTADVRPVSKTSLDVRPLSKPTADVRPVSKPTTDVRPVSKPTTDVRPVSKPTTDARPVSKAASEARAVSKSSEMKPFSKTSPAAPLVAKPSSADGRPVAKRPPPATIPLEKIKKSMNRIPGASIIPKATDKCDTSGALDLTKPNRLSEPGTKPSEPQKHILNGTNFLSSSKLLDKPQPEKNMQLSNLQMLSKVATEHPNINKTSPPVNSQTPKRPQMPSLQTLKVPIPQNANKANLAKLPKLNEINKTQFRLPNPQLKNMRPNQNQSVRNIPNPSLLVRQNQNRLNSISAASSSSESTKEAKSGDVKPEKGANEQKVVSDVSK